MHKNLARVPRSRSKVKGQGRQGQKNEKLLSHPNWQCIVGHAPYVGRTQQAATGDTIAWSPGGDGLRRWENQRMLFSFNKDNEILTNTKNTPSANPPPS